jgi:hypothetical protein
MSKTIRRQLPVRKNLNHVVSFDMFGGYVGQQPKNDQYPPQQQQHVSIQIRIQPTVPRLSATSYT